MLLEFLEAVGCKFSMDWDSHVIVAVPEELSHIQIREAIEPFAKELSRQVRYRAKRRRSVFVGGTLNGQEVGTQARGTYGHHMPNGRYGYWIRHRIKRGCWEVYEEDAKDGRAFFRGYATSERKARRGEIKKAHKTTEAAGGEDEPDL